MQIKPNKMSGLFWIQTILHFDIWLVWYFEKIFFQKDDFEKKQQTTKKITQHAELNRYASIH